MLYEMLAGETPFAAATPQATIARRFTDSPTPLRAIRESVPESVEHAVQKALSRTAADRFTSARAFADALGPALTTGVLIPSGASSASAASASTAPARGLPRRRLPIVLATLALGFAVGLGLLFTWRHDRAAEAGSAVRRLAVLPFENIGDSSHAYFADGITDAVRAKLTGLTELQVTASSSSDEYVHTDKNPRDIARELGVDYLPTGKVRWAKGTDGTSRVQVSPELIRASTASAAWHQSFDAPLTDVFQVQADIASRVASALDVALGDSARQQLAARPTENLAAYDAYLHAEEIVRSVSGLTGVRRAATYFERATALDPSFAIAWSRLSQAHSFLYLNRPTAADSVAALMAAERAMALEPQGAESHFAMGRYYRSVLADNTRAAAEYSAGLEASPRSSNLLRGLSEVESTMGEFDSAAAHLERAAMLDPRAAAVLNSLGDVLVSLRRYAEAESAYDRAIALAPTNLSSLEGRAMVEIARGNLPAAQAVLAAASPDIDPTALVAYLATYEDLYWLLTDQQQQLLLRLSPAAFDNDRALWAVVRAQTYWLRGDTSRARIYADTARIAFEDQLRSSPSDVQRRVFLGLSLAYLGRYDDVIREGQRAVSELPIAKDYSFGTYIQHQLARIYLVAGKNEKALDAIEPLLKVPYFLSPGWLRVDPNFEALHGNPRFEKLIAGD
ncbi:MAG TPA: tetratricopeptide repeat protein [Gemmatimonadaceae bacterium]|nr:tetratricopeptide repeat protein [Gemmatimonadaceae bacterium]HET7622133.1 tetratricopeptide repeat protein [Gemmatimonadaceae bacterium]